MRIHSPQITGSAANTNIVLTTITSSISVLSASFAATASFVQNAQSASFAITASHLLGQSPTSSYALTASFVLDAVSSSFAATASSADNLTVRGTLTAQTINVQTITSSIDYVTGSSINGSLLSNTHQFTGSVLMTGSLAVNESNVILTNQTSSMSVATASYWSGSIINSATASYVENAQSASYVQNAQTASYVLQAQSASYWSGSIINAATASYVENAQSASYWSGSILNATSASYALTASYASNVPETASYALQALSASFALTASYISGSGAGVGFPFSGSAIITGSLFVSGSTISGSFVGDGSGITGLTAGGKIHTQTSAASTWTVSHNLGVQYPNVTVYDNNNNVIIPQTIVATDSNTLTLTFGSAVSGYAVAGIGGIINVQGRTTQQYFTASTTWSFAHNLGDKYVSLQAFDDAFEMMIPTTIRLVDFTSSLMLFDSASSGYAVATIGGDLPAISSSYAGYTLQVASSAPYSASWVAVPNVTVTNAVSSSFAATASSADNLTVRGTLTAQTINVQTITSSIEFITGSTRNGSITANTHQFTGSVLMSGSLTVASLSSPEKISTIYGINTATTSGNGGDLTIKAGGGSGAGNTAGNLYLGFGRGNSSALNGSMYFGLAQATDSIGLDATYMAISSSGNVSIGTTVSKASLQVSSTLIGVPSIPSLGSTNGYVTTYFTNPNSLYGLLGGSLNDGNYWMQVQRTDGTATAYNLLLQPNGGNVGIGKSPGSKLDIDGTITANKFTSAESVVAIPNSATTIFNAASQSGVWLVTAVVQGNGIQAGYAIVGMRSESTLYLLASGTGGQMTFSVSGATLRLAQSAGGTINTSISVMKINQGG
jgi:hypothetical protein